MASSREYRAFQKLFSHLKNGIRGGIYEITDVLFSRNLIPEAVKSQVTTVSVPEDVKTSTLLDSIHQRIKGDKKSYYEFAEVLEEIHVFSYLAKEMRNEIKQWPEESAQEKLPHKYKKHDEAPHRHYTKLCSNQGEKS